MRPDRMLLQDMLEAAEVIRQFVPEDQSAFNADAPLQSHIFRHIMIIGEAAYRLSKGLKDGNPQIPWRNVEGMRHILVHDYFKIDWNEVYKTAKISVPDLKLRIEQVLLSLPPDQA